MDAIFDSVVQFIKTFRWDYGFEFTNQTSLQKDLGIYGDDADEFILAFSERFNVKIDEFDIDRYFTREGDPIIKSIIGIFRKSKNATKPICIGDLVKAVNAGRLDDSVINIENK